MNADNSLSGLLDRRALLGGLTAMAGAGLAAAFPGSALAAGDPNACRSMIGPKDTWIRGLPVIDAHCHIFNARDIPAIHFITKVFVPQYAVNLSAANKRRLASEISDFASQALGRTPSFEQERAVLEARLAGEPELAALAGSPALPKFARGSDRSSFGADVADNITAVRNLIAILTGFRHKNFEALSATNALSRPDTGVALFTPAMVDMDFWLGAGGESESSVGDLGTDASSLRQNAPARQVELMEMIQRLYPGRCHGFVSFCPWRQVDDLHHNATVGEGSGRRRQTALETVQDAILNRGFLGVKLYPPMGFAPLGNAALPPGAFPDALADTPYARDFGTLLDEALLGLYRFCVTNDVPVMAHGAPSNGAGAFTNSAGRKMDYALRAHPEGWRKVLEQPGLSALKLNFAHFGGSRDTGERPEWRATIGAMMDAYPNIYTDLSHYPEMLMDSYTGTGQRCSAAARALDPIRKEFLKSEAGVKRARRMLYGSDWSMLSKEFYYADYLPVVAHMYRRKIYGVGQGAEKNAQAFLSYNAAEFLGLRAGEKARTRLEAWYARHGLDPAPLRRFDAVGG